MYVQDYGAPVGWRLALADPDAVTAIITQNGNGYEAGFVDAVLEAGVGLLAGPDTRRPRPPSATALTLDAIRWQYLHGVPDESLVSPDTWLHDFALVSRPGNDLVQLACSPTTPPTSPLYPKLHEYLRDQPRAAAGGLGPQRRDLRRPRARSPSPTTLPGAEIHLLDGGHFLLESQLDAAAGSIRRFLDRALP